MLVRNLALGLIATLALTTGCAADDDPKTSAPDRAGEAPSSESSLPGIFAGNGISGCEALDIAEELPEDDLVGSWGYINTVWFYEGDNAFAYTSGTLELSEDGRWDGTRKADNMSGTAYGPGDWEFDGRSLVLSYDDGSFPETYDAVLVSDQVDGDGSTFRALTLVIDYGTDGCLVHTLGSAG
ncbi:hypothetical protein [Nocardioides dilutus]